MAARPLPDLVHPSWAAALAPVAEVIAELGEFLRAEIAAGRDLRAQELAQLGDYLRDRRQRCRPRGVDEVGERARRHTFSFSPVNGSVPRTYAAGRLSR